MTTPTVQRSQRAIAALAALVHEAQTETGRHTVWDEPGIAAEIRRHPHVGLFDLAIHLLRCASDPRNDTPAALSQPGNRAWDDDRPWPCPTHPQHHTRRPDGECSGCYVDRQADECPTVRDRGGRPIPDTARELLTAAIRKPRPATPDDATAAESPKRSGVKATSLEAT